MPEEVVECQSAPHDGLARTWGAKEEPCTCGTPAQDVVEQSEKRFGVESVYWVEGRARECFGFLPQVDVRQLPPAPQAGGVALEAVVREDKQGNRGDECGLPPSPDRGPKKEVQLREWLLRAVRHACRLFSPLTKSPMTPEHVARTLFPPYGAWKSGRDLWDTHVRSAQERQRTQTYGQAAPGEEAFAQDQLFNQGAASGGALLLFFVLTVFVIIIPAAQAFTCFGPTNLALPGWAWGFLILLFWPMGIVWLALQGRCQDDAAGLAVQALEAFLPASSPSSARSLTSFKQCP